VIFVETLLRRWYAFAFLAGYFAASVPERGWKASLRFAAIGFGVAFATEYCSTRTGFPFSSYHYTGKTRGDEVYLSNVPLFVPLSYAVMIYAGRSVGLRVVRGSRAIGLVIAGALCTMAIDVVVDPVTLRGEHWFLGDLYSYEGPGHWFGVPLGNFGGWFLVSAVVLAVDLLLSHGDVTAKVKRGVVLAAGVVAFNLAVAFAIGKPLVGLASLALAAALLVLVSMSGSLFLRTAGREPGPGTRTVST
jgi:putative membrane protein